MKTAIVAFVAVTALAAGAAHARVLAGTYDGFCDGFSLTLTKDGAAYGFETGCIGGAIAGARGLSHGAVINEPHVASAVYKINEVAQTWTIYTTTGAILQSGTYTPVPAGAAVAPNLSLPRTGTK